MLPDIDKKVKIVGCVCAAAIGLDPGRKEMGKLDTS